MPIFQDLLKNSKNENDDNNILHKIIDTILLNIWKNKVKNINRELVTMASLVEKQIYEN